MTLTQKDYRNYLIELKDRVFKILPLYDEQNEFVVDHIDSVCFELCGLRKLIEELPHGIWYAKSLATLNQLKIEVEIVGQNKRIKKEVFRVLNMIDKQIDNLKGE